MKEKIYNSVVVRFIEHRAGLINQAPTNQARSCSIYRAITNERGATLIMVAISMVVIFGFAVLALDVSMMLLARTQLKNAADSAALAGASALVDGDVAAATEQAIRFAGYNVAIQDTMSPVRIFPENIIFPDENTIQVTTHRTVATNDPVSLFFLRVINSASDNKGNVTATSSAKVSGVCATYNLRPWCPPDRWDDRDNDGVYDVTEWDDKDKDGVCDKGEWDDVDKDKKIDSAEFYDPWITGYRYPKDIGTQIVLKAGKNKVKNWPLESWYYAVDYPPINKGDPISGAGADSAYRNCIINGSGYEWLIEVDDKLQIEPGMKTGPTKQGLTALINSDLTAEWDPATEKVINSAFAVSPRIIKACLFDPTVSVQTDAKGRPYVTIAKIMVLFIEDPSVVFIEDYKEGDIIGRFMRMASQGENCEEPGSFLYKVALVPGPEEE